MVQFVTLTRENLNNPDVLRAIDENRVVLVVGENWTKPLVGKIMPTMRVCEKYLSAECNRKYVRLVIEAIVTERHEECEMYLDSETRRCKFLCHILGSMLEYGIFKCSANDLAKAIRSMFAYTQDTLKRYINEGRSCGYIEIIRVFDKSIPNNPA